MEMAEHEAHRRVVIDTLLRSALLLTTVAMMLTP